MLKKILVIQTAFIGDAVLATALLEKLHQFYPNAALSMLIRKGNEGLFDQHPYLDQVLIWNKKNGKYKDLWRLLKQIRSTKFDLVVNVQRFAATGLLTAFSGAKHTVGFDKNPISFLFSKSIQHLISDQHNPLHEIERNQQLIVHLTDEKPAHPLLYPTEKDFNRIKKYQHHPYICVAPASVWYTKQFPEGKWIDFIKLVPYPVYILGGPGDHA
ncbi:MAG: glycosyltransferase family 9 protein, partial [Bacteroidota bacterium]